MAPLNINQQAMTLIKGMFDMKLNPNTIPCVVSASESTALVAGQGVKVVDNTSKVPTVTTLTADTEAVYGVVGFNPKDQSFAAGAAVEIAKDFDIIYMEASAAIAKGADVMYVVSGQKVATATSGKAILGKAFDKASASGDLIRIEIRTGATAA